MGRGHPELTVILNMAFFCIIRQKTSCTSEVMGKGIRSFKNGLREVEETDMNLKMFTLAAL